MKKLISLKMIFLYLLIILSVLIIFNNNDKNNITYINIGDGYAKGKNSYYINDYGYSDYLKDKIEKDNKLKEYNSIFTDNDNTINDIKIYLSNSRKNDIASQKKSLKSYLQEADIVTLSVGMNDLKSLLLIEEEMNKEKYNTIISKVEKEYDDLIKEIKKYYRHNIYVVEYPNNSLDSYYLSKAIRSFNNYLRNKKDIVLIPITKLENDRNKYFDSTKSNYYNKNGHQLISSIIYKKYKKT